MSEFEVLETKQDQEKEELDIKIKALLKAAKKSNKAQVEAECIQMQYDLKAKHRDELEELEERLGTIKIDEPVVIKKVEDEAEKKKQEEALIQQKKLKAKKKQDKRESKEKEKEVTKQEIAKTAGKSQRDLETEILLAKLIKDQLKIRDIPSDGNCLYRALADQLNLAEKVSSYDFSQLRKIAAKHLRSTGDEYAPFLGLDSNDSAFDEYCSKVESDQLAEWGGQIEIKALSEALHHPIYVYSSDAPVLITGEDEDGIPLRVSFHRYYYALGEHYNSVVMADI